MQPSGAYNFSFVSIFALVAFGTFPRSSDFQNKS